MLDHSHIFLHICVEIRLLEVGSGIGYGPGVWLGVEAVVDRGVGLGVGDTLSPYDINFYYNRSCDDVHFIEYSIFYKNHHYSQIQPQSFIIHIQINCISEHEIGDMLSTTV